MSDPVTTRPGWRMLGRHLRGRGGVVAAVLALSVLEALPVLLSGLLIARALDRGFLAGRPLVGLAWLAVLGVAMVLRAAVTRQLLPRLGVLVEPLRDALVSSVVSATLRRGVAGTARSDGASVARLTGQVETVRALVSALLRSVRQVGVSLVMALVGLAALALPVAAIAGVSVVLTLAAYMPLLRVLSRRRRALLIADERLAAEAGQTLAGLRDLVAAGARGRARERLDVLIGEWEAASRAVARTGAVSALLVSAGGKLPVLAVFVMSPWLLAGHGLTVGALVGAVGYLLTTIEPTLRSMVDVIGSWGIQLHTVLQRLGEADVPSEPAPRHPAHPPAEAGPAEAASAGADLVIDRLTFGYGPHAEPVIRDLTLAVPAGAVLVVVGPSGIGKSTLADLLAGLATPGAGQVRIGGFPVDRLGEDWLRRHVVLIPQEAYIFTGTLRENLCYLRPEAADTELARAATAVGADRLIGRLGGLDTRLGVGGAVLSAGERQLLALVRAYVSDARVVLLDEATCHLDPGAEARAELAFARRGGTVVVIAHRMSSALRADRILLMDSDRTLSGTHPHLLAASPRYADLVGYWTGSHADTRDQHTTASPA